MSSPPPARRRRIAGERRRPPVDELGPPADDRAHDARTDPPAAPVPVDDPAPEIPTPAVGPATASSAGRPRRSRSVPRPGPLDAMFGGLALLGAAVIAVLLLGLPQGPVRALGLPDVPDLRDVLRAEAAQTAAETAPSVAERAAGAILAYDHRNLDADQDAAQRFMTPSFAAEYAETFDDSVEPPARTYRAQVTSEVKGTSVLRASPDRVLVLLFVDQTTRSTAHDGPQLALNRVEFEMVRSDGEWLVDDISSY